MRFVLSTGGPFIMVPQTHVLRTGTVFQVIYNQCRTGNCNVKPTFTRAEDNGLQITTVITVQTTPRAEDNGL